MRECGNAERSTSKQHRQVWDESLMMQLGTWSDQRRYRGASAGRRRGVRGTQYDVRPIRRSGAELSSGWWLRRIVRTAYRVLRRAYAMLPDVLWHRHQGAYRPRSAERLLTTPPTPRGAAFLARCISAR